jgi:hypothetical protein
MIAELDQLQAAYKATVEAWIAAIKDEEVLAIGDRDGRADEQKRSGGLVPIKAVQTSGTVSPEQSFIASAAGP